MDWSGEEGLSVRGDMTIIVRVCFSNFSDFSDLNGFVIIESLAHREGFIVVDFVIYVVVLGDDVSL